MFLHTSCTPLSSCIPASSSLLQLVSFMYGVVGKWQSLYRHELGRVCVVGVAWVTGVGICLREYAVQIMEG